MRKVESHRRQPSNKTESLLSDIKYLENRLEEMGYNGDCAYERAMSQAFEQLITEKRQTLASLNHNAG